MPTARSYELKDFPEPAPQPSKNSRSFGEKFEQSGANEFAVGASGRGQHQRRAVFAGVAVGEGEGHTEKNPHQLAPMRVSFFKSLAVTYFHIDKVDTSIGAERFHFRVRKGIGWFPLAMAARQTGRCGGWSCPAPAANSYNLFRCWVAFK